MVLFGLCLPIADQPKAAGSGSVKSMTSFFCSERYSNIAITVSALAAAFIRKRMPYEPSTSLASALEAKSLLAALNVHRQFGIRSNELSNRDHRAAGSARSETVAHFGILEWRMLSRL